MMNKMTTSMIAGGLIGAGLWAMSDKGTRKKVSKQTNKITRKAEGVMGKMV